MIRDVRQILLLSFDSALFTLGDFELVVAIEAGSAVTVVSMMVAISFAESLLAQRRIVQEVLGVLQLVLVIIVGVYLVQLHIVFEVDWYMMLILVQEHVNHLHGRALASFHGMGWEYVRLRGWLLDLSWQD